MNNPNGFQTKVWGPAAWFFLHMVSFNYMPEKAKEYKRFFTSLKDVLPCGACRENYSKLLKTMPMDDSLNSRNDFAFWLFKVHNRVANDIYSKTKLNSDAPIFTNSKSDFKKVVDFYENFRAKCTKNAYGCVIPVKGSRKMCKIKVVPFKGRKNYAIKLSG